VQARQAEQRDRRAERETSCRRHDHDPFARPLPDPVGYGTVPLTGFRVRALPGSAAEAEERQAEAVTRRAIPALTRVGRYRLESTPYGGTRWLPIE